MKCDAAWGNSLLPCDLDHARRGIDGDNLHTAPSEGKGIDTGTATELQNTL